jgi:hypothetical protein
VNGRLGQPHRPSFMHLSFECRIYGGVCHPLKAFKLCLNRIDHGFELSKI